MVDWQKESKSLLDAGEEVEAMAPALDAIERGCKALQDEVPDLIAHREDCMVQYDQIVQEIDEFAAIVRDEIYKDTPQFSTIWDLKQKYDGLLLRQQLLAQELAITEDEVEARMLYGMDDFWEWVKPEDFDLLRATMYRDNFSGEHQDQSE